MDFHAERYGAVGDGQACCTAALQAAIGDCARAGGGRVVVSPGRYLIGTLELFSNVELHLEAGAVLLASLDPADYPDRDSACWDHAKLSRQNAKSLIYAERADRVAITGPGQIDCRGRLFCTDELVPISPGMAPSCFKRISNDLYPARVIWLVACTQVRLEDFSLTEAFAGWAVWLLACERIRVSGLTITADTHLPNTDGVHLSGCQYASVSDCHIATGDDCIVLRAPQSVVPQPGMVCRYITVSNCTLSSDCQAIRLGWQGDSQISDAVFSNIVIEHGRNGIHCFVPNLEGRGFGWFGPTEFERPLYVRNILFSNIVMKDVRQDSIRIEARSKNPGLIENISFQQLVCETGNLPRFLGTAALPLRHITLSDCRFTARADEGGVPIRHAQEVTFSNTSFTWADEPHE